MSGLIMTLSDDEDDIQQQIPQSQYTLTADQKKAQRQQANKLPTSKSSSTTATKKPTKSLAQQLAEAEAEGEDGDVEMKTADGDDDEEDFEMTKAPTPSKSSKKPAPAKTSQAQKRKADVAELDAEEADDDDDDDDGLPASGSFAWDVDATSDELTPSSTIAVPSKQFQPYNATTGTSLQQKIAQQLEKSGKKQAKKKAAGEKKSKDSDDDMDVSSSEDDEDSEADSEDDDDEDEEKADTDADQVDSDVDMHEYKDDEVKKKVTSIKSTGPKVIQATPLPQSSQVIQDFASLRLSRPLLRAVSDLGWTQPTPVQSSSILPAVAGQDLLVNAVTGSGKTGAFMLPILERLLYRPKRVPLTRVLVLLPTRELAAQCLEVSQHLAKYTDIRICLVVGGLSEKVQEQELRNKPDIVLATPGRLIDHLRNTQNVHLEDIEILVLDEADRLLETGFADELKEIIKECPKGRQTLLFSATLTDHVVDLINLSLNQPVRIKIDAYESIVDRLKQEFIRIRGSDKDKDTQKEREAIILSLAKRSFQQKTIIFMSSKLECHRMSIIFGLAKLKAAELQGNMTQTQRLESLEEFRTGKVDFLLCTDLAARGLDISGVETVLNMSMPRELRQYIHRVGRTARAGRSGRAVTLIGEGQRGTLKELVKKAKDVVHSRVVPAEIIAKFRTIIKEMEPDIRAIFDEESEEKAARVAEMEANKLQNTMRFQEDILNRPAKTWFQTPAEKAATKAAGIKLFNTADEDDHKPEPVKKLSKKQLERLEAKEKKLKDKTALLGLSRAKKRRKLMMMEDEKMAKEQAREAKKHEAGSLRAESLPEVLPPLTLAQQEKMQRVLGKKAKKETRKEKQEELGIIDQKEKRRELQAMQLMKSDKKKGQHVYQDGDSKKTKETSIIGSNFRYKDRTGSGDDRYKLPHRKFKEEQALRKKGESTNKSPSDKKKGSKKAHHAFKSQTKFKRR